MNLRFKNCGYNIVILNLCNLEISAQS